MKRRTIRIQGLSGTGLVGLAWLQLAVMTVLLALGIPLVFTSPVLSGIAMVYSVARVLGFQGRPLEIGIGKKPKPLPVAEPPLPRSPSAFPPEPGQCYICGTYDDERRRKVTGSAAHFSCQEWLGKWEPPQWKVRYASRPIRLGMHTGRYEIETYGSGFATVPVNGWMTREELEKFCRECLSGHELLSAQRGEEPRINLQHLNKEEA